MAYTTIDDPSEYFTTTLYTGTSDDSVKTVTNDANVGDFKPDWLWIKARSGTYAARDHALYDSSRGATKRLESNATDAEATDSNNTFNTNGFTLTSNYSINGPSTNHVAWQWKANGGTTTTNDASATGIGNTDSVYQANTEAGFSIVTFSGTGSGMTVAHGLGGTPTLIISKARNDTENWAVHTTLIDGSLDYLRLSETDAAGNSSFSLPTSTVFGYNGSNNYIAYCFRSIQGYSKIGTYIGNGNANGAFVYTGFKPAWVMLKRTDSAASWLMFDNKRDIDNVVSHRVYANGSDGEDSDTGSAIDFLSNGFKCRSSDSSTNTSSGTYIYMAFAENPFVSSKGVPTTAR